MLNHELGLTLALAAKAADLVLTDGLAPNRIRLSASADGSMALRLDLERFLSTTNASLAAAFAFAPTRGPGRPPRHLQPKVLIDALPSTLEIRVGDDGDKLANLAEQLRDWEAYPRGIERGLPFIMDVATLRVVPHLPLVTSRGEIDVIVETAGADQAVA